MKVLLINGSPHVDGVIALALKELSDTLNRCDIYMLVTKISEAV